MISGEPVRLSKLKNIKGILVRWLREIGVTTVAQFAEQEPLELWKQMKRLHPREVTLDALWAMEGALRDIDSSNVPASRKKYLQKEANSWVRNRGLE